MKLFLISALLFTGFTSTAQGFCATNDVKKYPGKWTWKKDGTAAQWQFTEPIRKEIQRILPSPLEGLFGEGSMAFWRDNAYFNLPSPRSAEFYLILRKYECLEKYKLIQPEGETGCWVYFLLNNIEGVKFPLQTETSIKDPETDKSYQVMNMEIRTDAAGNQLIYTSSKPGIYVPHCYYFSSRKGLPRKRISNRALFLLYKKKHEKRVTEDILRFEKMIAADEKTYQSLSAKEKAEQPYWIENGKKNKVYLEKFRAEKETILNWYKKSMLRNDLDSPACVQTVNPYIFSPEKLDAAPGMGFGVWEDNPDFFDLKKPKDEPQCMALYIRRQDNDKPKKDFMDLFYSQFNLDVLARLTGEKQKKINGINSISHSISDKKSATLNAQQTTENSMDFSQSVPGNFPADWEGEDNISVRNESGKNQLALDKPGYWYPRQYNQEIQDKFSLSFDLSWNKDIPYYGGLFTVSFSKVAYDNPSEKYRTDINPASFWSLYDSYAGGFNRVVCWLDVHGNNGGTLEVISYSASESQVAVKKVNLPAVAGANNKHQLRFERSGNALVIYIDNRKEAQVENAFIPEVAYNLYAFSRYKGTTEKTDVFFLNNIKVKYK